MHVFVTGASGFVGRATVEALLHRNHGVRVLVHHREIPDDWPSKGVESVSGDVLDPVSLKGKLDGCDAVIHLPGIIQERRGATFERIHIEGTLNTVNAAVEAGALRFIHASALGTRANAVSRYHRTKWKAEEIIRNAPVEQTIFRPSVIVGPNSLFCKQMADLVKWNPIVPAITTPNGFMQPIHIDDVTHCFAACLEDEKTAYKTYSLGGPSVYTFREILEAFAGALGKKRLFVPIPAPLMVLPAFLMQRLIPHPPVTPEQLIMLRESNTCNITETQKTFGVPKKTLEQSLQELYGSN